MDNLIVFDSDFIITNISTLKEYLEKFVDYECFITDISLNEISISNSFNKLKIISDFKMSVKNYHSLGISFENSDEDIKKIIEDESKKYIKYLFKDKIIKNHSRTLEQLLKRSYDKIPPFGKSDTGFKDTIILLDIIDYIKVKKVTKAFLVTNDEDFVKNRLEIEEEVRNKTNCEFYIVDGKNTEKLLNYFKLGNDKKISKLSEEINGNLELDIKNLREDLKDICYNLFHYDGVDPYGIGEYVGNNFRVSSAMSKQLIEEFLENLTYNINKNIFNFNVVISDFFEDPFLFSKEEKIDITVFEKLNTIYSQIKTNIEYKDALINLLITNFNELIYRPMHDLPF